MSNAASDSSSSDDGPTAEHADRAAPNLENLCSGDSRTVEASRSSRFLLREIEFEASQAAEAEVNDRDGRVAPSTHRPDSDESVAQTQQIRRLDNSSYPRHHAQPWEGGEHVGTVVAVEGSDVIVHVGRHEYVRVSTPKLQPDCLHLLGRQIGVNRDGSINELPLLRRERIDPSQSIESRGR